MKTLISVFLVSLILLTGCSSNNFITEQQVETQSRADIAVASILFDTEMSTHASYNVRKNGHVEIEFAKSVKLFNYTMVVEKLRNHRDIKSVFAIQSGQVVCPMQ